MEQTQWCKYKIVITGGSGFIGTNLMDFYINDGIEVVNIDIKKPRKSAHNDFWREADINDIDTLRKIFDEVNPDFVFHLAARTDLDGKHIDDYITNTGGLQNVIVVCKNIKHLQRVVFASSKLVCKNGYIPKDDHDYCPDTAYGESKVEGEKRVAAMRDSNFSWVIVRPTSIWGPWFEIPYRNFFNTIRKGLYIHPKGVRSQKTYGFSGNTIFQLNKIMLAPDHVVDKKILYLGDYEPIEVKNWGDLISEELNVRKPVEVPLFFLEILARLGDTFKHYGVKSFPYSSFRLNNILAETAFDLSELKALCGATPFSLSDGIKITVDWLKSTNWQ
ncbi:MAG: NAD(P)-dependent oxidoreductase [Syntrophomonas sp.]